MRRLTSCRIDIKPISFALILLSHEAEHLEAGPSRRKRLVFQHEARRCPSTRVVMSFHESSKARFAAYVEALTEAIGHADRATPLRHYCTGLLMPAALKSVEP